MYTDQGRYLATAKCTGYSDTERAWRAAATWAPNGKIATSPANMGGGWMAPPLPVLPVLGFMG